MPCEDLPPDGPQRAFMFSMYCKRLLKPMKQPGGARAFVGGAVLVLESLSISKCKGFIVDSDLKTCKSV